jgi:hypothetical protein
LEREQAATKEQTILIDEACNSKTENSLGSLLKGDDAQRELPYFSHLNSACLHLQYGAWTTSKLLSALQCYCRRCGMYVSISIENWQRCTTSHEASFLLSGMKNFSYDGYNARESVKDSTPGIVSLTSSALGIESLMSLYCPTTLPRAFSSSEFWQIFLDARWKVMCFENMRRSHGSSSPQSRVRPHLYTASKDHP